MMDDKIINLLKGDALLIVDVQNDFLPGGNLAVTDGDKIIPFLNQCIKQFHQSDLPIFASRDWHPENHCSFKKEGGIWPPHCIANTPGAQFASSLDLPEKTIIISKATTSNKDAYSAFEGTDLHKKLQDKNVQQLFVGGLATDYCVLNSVKDAISNKYRVYVLQDGIQAVNVDADDGVKAEKEMQKLGAIFINSKSIAV